jgi:hypothetical protein
VYEKCVHCKIDVPNTITIRTQNYGNVDLILQQKMFQKWSNLICGIILCRFFTLISVYENIRKHKIDERIKLEFRNPGGGRMLLYYSKQVHAPGYCSSYLECKYTSA